MGAGLAAPARRGHEGLELAHGVLLPDELLEPLGPQAALGLLLAGLLLPVDQPVRVVRHPRPPPSATRPALTRSSVVPSAPASAASASAGA